MLRDFRRVQDLVLLLARWLLLAGMVLLYLRAPDDPLVPIALIGALALWTLFLTIAFVGGWLGSAAFAYVQSVGDLALVAAGVVLAPGLLDRAYQALLVVSVVIGLRRFSWGPTAGFAVLVAAISAFAQREGLALAATEPEVLLPLIGPPLVVLLGRLVAGEPVPAHLLDYQPPVRDDQVRALQALGKTLAEHSEREPLLKEAHRVMLAQTGATRAAVVLLDEAGGEGHAYAYPDGHTQVAAVPLAADGTTPHERVLRDGPLRLTRQRDPLPVVSVVGDRGATSFAGAPLRIGGMTLGALLAYDKGRGHPFQEQDEVFLGLASTALAAALFGGSAATSAAETAELFPHALLSMLALRRPEAEDHADQVARFAEAIAHEMGLTESSVAALRLGALVHDVGELGVAGDPFNRLQTLSSDEYERIKEHPEIGMRLLATLDQADEVLTMVLQHHERWDGAGYPQGLARADIDQRARILAVADALDAMTAPRPYRAQRPVREALQELVGNSGTQFDPTVVQALLAVVARESEGWVAAPARKERRRVEPWRGRARRT